MCVPTTSVRGARDRRFSPLDQKLRLRSDQFSEGAARVAARAGLEAKSFERAAASFVDAVGSEISADSVARLSEGFGQAVEGLRAEEAERAGRVAERDEAPGASRVEEVEPIEGQANVSTDGMMVLVRGEGWKEAKATVISKVSVELPEARVEAGDDPEREGERKARSRRADDPRVRLSQHSYQVGLWDAETLGKRQYAEGLRRGLERVEKLSSVNDAAPYIERVTALNFPKAAQIVDWPHAAERVWAVGKAVFGEGQAQTTLWAEARLDGLWEGHVGEVIAELGGLDLQRECYPAEVQQAEGYFRNNQDRMRYDAYRAAGYPIGSGTVESAAKNVVHARLKRPGRGWNRGNAEGMLAALGELHSGRFETVWQSSSPSAVPLAG